MKECSICYDDLNIDIFTTTCKHNFHASCIDNWTSIGNVTCPLCRNVICDDDFSDFVLMFYPEMYYALEDNSIDIIEYLTSKYKYYNDL